jgi:hypothetical protein
VFSGRHLSFDYHYGVQALAVEGFRSSSRLDRFSYWTRISEQFVLPPVLEEVASRYEHFNVEVIGDRVIEVHFRYNDDFENHNADTIVPVWKENFYASACGDRLGFILVESKEC